MNTTKKFAEMSGDDLWASVGGTEGATLSVRIAALRDAIVAERDADHAVALREAERRGAFEALTKAAEMLTEDSRHARPIAGSIRKASAQRILACRDEYYAPPRPYPSRTLPDGRVFRQVGPDAFRWTIEGIDYEVHGSGHWSDSKMDGFTRAEFAAIDAVLAEAV